MSSIKVCSHTNIDGVNQASLLVLESHLINGVTQGKIEFINPFWAEDYLVFSALLRENNMNLSQIDDLSIKIKECACDTAHGNIMSEALNKILSANIAEGNLKNCEVKVNINLHDIEINLLSRCQVNCEIDLLIEYAKIYFINILSLLASLLSELGVKVSYSDTVIDYNE